MKIYEKKMVRNHIGKWKEHYIFGKKVHSELLELYRYM